ncbi:MAG: DUF5829 family protein [Vicinamibacterales bacterium]
MPTETLVGDSGLGLMVETRGGVDAVAERLRTRFGGAVATGDVPRTIDGASVPWFREVAIEAEGQDRESLSVWVMETDPGYLALAHPGAVITDPLSRAQYLGFQYRPERPLRDVTSVMLALHAEPLKRLRAQLELFGWRVRDRKDGGFEASGSEVQVTVQPTAGREGVLRIDLGLATEQPSRTEQLGNMKLRIHSREAAAHVPLIVSLLRPCPNAASACARSPSGSACGCGCSRASLQRARRRPGTPPRTRA